MSVLEGSLGILPRRVLVADEQVKSARQLLVDAGLGSELRPDAGEPRKTSPTTRRWAAACACSNPAAAIASAMTPSCSPPRPRRAAATASPTSAPASARPASRSHRGCRGAGDARRDRRAPCGAGAERMRRATVLPAGRCGRARRRGSRRRLRGRRARRRKLRYRADESAFPRHRQLQASPDPAAAPPHAIEAANAHGLGGGGATAAAAGRYPDADLPGRRPAHAARPAVDGFGAVAVMPVHPKPGAAAIRVLLGAVKASRAPLAIRPGLVLARADGTPSPAS